jgi:hypothetical protein
MQTLTRLFVLPIAFLVLASSSLFAAQQPQQHVVAPSDLSSAVVEHAASQDADRAAVHEALQKPAVRDVASSVGVDLSRVDGVVDTMSGEELTKAGNAARQINEQLVGGASTVVISTTTILLVLLLIIIIILVVR